MKKLLLVPLFIIACTPLGENFKDIKEPKDEEALVYFYRPSAFFGAGISYEIMDNENKITKLYNGGYSVYSTNPGNKLFSATTETTTELPLKLERGKVYFVEGGIGWGTLVGRPKLVERSKEAALEEIKDCKEILEK